MPFTIENHFTPDQLDSIIGMSVSLACLAIVYFILIRPLSKTDWERMEHELRVPRGTYENDPDVNVELRRKLKRLKNRHPAKLRFASDAA